MARSKGDRVRTPALGFGSVDVGGTITEVHEVPGHPELNEYSVVWDDGQYADEIWGEEDFADEETV